MSETSCKQLIDEISINEMSAMSAMKARLAEKDEEIARILIEKNKEIAGLKHEYNNLLIAYRDKIREYTNR